MNVRNILLELGFVPSLTGFEQTALAVELVFDDITLSMQDVYRQISCDLNTQPLRVERNIRHALNNAWILTRLDKLKALGLPMDKKPGVKEFVFTLALFIKQQIKGD